MERTYRQQQSALLNEIKAEGRDLILEDGQCDSLGHSAKYGSYSLMDAEQNKILDSQLVQVCISIKALSAEMLALTEFSIYLLSYRVMK